MKHSFDWTTGYASRRSPVFARNVVSTSHPLAAQAGLRMLQNGGNAVDAIIATAAVLTIVEPCSNGLGSDAFCILWDGAQLHGLNASGCAPAAWTPGYFSAKYGADKRTPPKRGWDSVTVPGAVAGWVALHGRFGKLPFADLLAPAIEVAERGYAVPVIIQQKWRNAASLAEITSQPGFAEAFLPHGREPAGGRALHLRRSGAHAAADRRDPGRGLLSRRNRRRRRGPCARARRRHDGGRLRGLPAGVGGAHRRATTAATGCTRSRPTGRASRRSSRLGILDKFDLASMPVDGVASQHLQIEAMKLAFADVYKYVGEPRSMRLTPAQMLDDGYLASRARLIDPKRAQDFGPGHAPQGGTVYLTAADESGMMVSFIQSNYMGFGSGIVVPGYGLSLQNRGHGFTLDPASDNLVGPGKRPFHTIIPAFLTKDGQPVMSYGVMGGDMQPQGHLQTLVRMLDYRQHPQAACDAPRWRWNAGLVNAEQGFDPATAQGLRELGHRVEPFADSYQDYGAGQFIWRLGDPAVEGYAAASDPRRDGQAVGF